ncbi:MAG: hypothetical protein R3E50_16555 [Halioglobus sp.]
MRTLYLARCEHSAEALKAGDITLEVNGTESAALVDVLSQITQLEQCT